MSTQDIPKVFRIVCQGDCAKSSGGEACSNITFNESPGNDLWALESIGTGIYRIRNAITGFWAFAFENRVLACPNAEDGSAFQLVPAKKPGGFIVNLLGSRIVWVVKPFSGYTKVLRLGPAIESDDTVFHFEAA